MAFRAVVFISFGPVTFGLNGPSGWPLFDVVALWAYIYQLIALSERNGPSARSFLKIITL
jgi:hypothetical protein